MLSRCIPLMCPGRQLNGLVAPRSGLLPVLLVWLSTMLSSLVSSFHYDTHMGMSDHVDKNEGDIEMTSGQRDVGC